MTRTWLILLAGMLLVGCSGSNTAKQASNNATQASSTSATPSSPQPATNPEKDADASLPSFVQRFYDEYTRAFHREQFTGWTSVLEHQSSLLSPELFQELKQDAEAQAAVSGEIVGLDFDPFLNTQDPCDRYQVGKLTQANGHYLVEVYGVCSGQQNQQPDVVAELAQSGESWEFTNFRYPNANTDLRAILKELRDDRQRSTQPNTSQ